MTRNILAILFVASAYPSATVDAQHFHGHHGMFHIHGFSQPFVAYPGYFGGPIWPAQVASYSYTTPTIYVPITPIVEPNPLKATPIPSTPTAKAKSIDYQRKGDHKLREQKWSDARLAYSNSVKVAPDRADAHLRMGLCYVMIQRFDSAIREFKRAVFLDPSIPKSGESLSVIFGPNNKIAMNAMISKLGDWVGEDIHNSDRLFLLGVVLHFSRDPRAIDAFQAALKIQRDGDVSHIAPFLSPPVEQGQFAPQPMPDGIPSLKEQAAAPAIVPPEADLRFSKFPTTIAGAPVPMP